MTAEKETPKPLDDHFYISEKATANLAALADGNGLKAEQVRLVRQNVEVYQLPGVTKINLRLEMSETQLKGKHPRGEVLSSVEAVHTKAESQVQGFLKAMDVHKEIQHVLEHTPEKGFGSDFMKIQLHSTKKEYSVIDTCLKCNGQSYIPCNLCNATGTLTCKLCHGLGHIQCITCLGIGQCNHPDGSYGQCLKCFGTGKLQCHGCMGLKTSMCTECTGHGRNACLMCDQSGFLSHNFQTIFRAEMQFDLDRQKIPEDVLEVIEKVGVKVLAKDGHAEIFGGEPEVMPDHLLIHYIAFFAIAQADISLEGKVHTAVIYGLHAKFLHIDPVLDPFVKPGINALLKVSKGPLAVQALIDTACKYKLIRQVLSELTQHSKKATYKKLIAEYPFVLSEKYAKATVAHGSAAIHAIGDTPRKKGLAAGTVLTAFFSAIYFMSPLRQALLIPLIQRGLVPNLILADAIPWVIGYVLTVFLIKISGARAFERFFPRDMKKKGTLPSAGKEGAMAFVTTLGAWILVAALVPARPEWMIEILQQLKLLH